MSLDTLPVHDVPPNAGRDLLSRARSECDPILRTAVSWLGEPLATMAGYHFGWWDVNRDGVDRSYGKSIRAALVWSAAEACGDVSAAAPAGAAAELVHNFSLVHDDVMDEDATRRGRATVWAVWGKANAILLGDALHALACRVMAQMLSSVVAARAVMRLESSCLAMCLGQFEDCAFETRPTVGVEDYLKMAAAKTAELMGCACGLGALVAGADAVAVAAMEQFGCGLGVAFQIVDDMMGIWGAPEVTGKPVGNDLARRKATLPVVAAINSGSPAGTELARLYRSPTPMSAADIARATELVDAAGGRQAAHRYAEERIGAAMAALPDELRSPGLTALAHLVIDRDR